MFAFGQLCVGISSVSFSRHCFVNKLVHSINFAVFQKEPDDNIVLRSFLSYPISPCFCATNEKVLSETLVKTSTRPLTTSHMHNSKQPKTPRPSSPLVHNSWLSCEKLTETEQAEVMQPLIHREIWTTRSLRQGLRVTQTKSRVHHQTPGTSWGRWIYATNHGGNLLTLASQVTEINLGWMIGFKNLQSWKNQVCQKLGRSPANPHPHPSPSWICRLSRAITSGLRHPFPATWLLYWLTF